MLLAFDAARVLVCLTETAGLSTCVAAGFSSTGAVVTFFGRPRVGFGEVIDSFLLSSVAVVFVRVVRVLGRGLGVVVGFGAGFGWSVFTIAFFDRAVVFCVALATGAVLVSGTALGCVGPRGVTLTRRRGATAKGCVGPHENGSLASLD